MGYKPRRTFFYVKFLELKMGTNYYAEINKCECCKRCDKIHIGKSSMGWAFTFRGYKNPYGYIETDEGKDVPVPDDFCISSWKDWKEYLKNTEIIDEYGRNISYDEFVDLVEHYKSPDYVREDGRKNLNHNEEILKDPSYSGNVWKEYNDPNKHWNDELGYSFSSTVFS